MQWKKVLKKQQVDRQRFKIKALPSKLLGNNRKDKEPEQVCRINSGKAVYRILLEGITYGTQNDQIATDHKKYLYPQPSPNPPNLS